MGEATHGVVEKHDEKKHETKPPVPPEQLEREVEHLREHLDSLIGELDLRRHELFDWRLQVRRHAVLVGSICGGLLLLAGGLIAKAARDRRQARIVPTTRMQRIADALAKTPAKLEREKIIRREPDVMQKALSAAVSGASVILAKALMQRLVEPLMVPPEPATAPQGA